MPRWSLALGAWVVGWWLGASSGERRWDRRNEVEDDDPGVRACVSFGLRSVLCHVLMSASGRGDSTMEATALSSFQPD